MTGIIHEFLVDKIITDYIESPLLKPQEINALIENKYNLDWFHGMELKFMKIPKTKRK